MKYGKITLSSATKGARFRPSPPALLLGFVRKKSEEKASSFSETFSSRTTGLQSETNPATYSLTGADRVGSIVIK